jgi:uncharacterized protein YkwD
MSRDDLADGGHVRTTRERSTGRSRRNLTVVLPLAVALAVSVASISSAAAVVSIGPASASHAKTSVHKARRHHRHKPKAKVSKPNVSNVTPAPVVSPGLPPARLAICADADLVPAPENVDRLAAAILCLVNQERAVAGIGQLRPVATMTAAARAHSLEMVLENYLAQISPADISPVERLTQTGYLRPDGAIDVSENLAGETGTASTPGATVKAWMNSPSSRGVILSAVYTDTGIGVIAAAPAITGSGPGATYTEDFGASS